MSICEPQDERSPVIRGGRASKERRSWQGTSRSRFGFLSHVTFDRLSISATFNSAVSLLFLLLSSRPLQCPHKQRPRPPRLSSPRFTAWPPFPSYLLRLAQFIPLFLRTPTPNRHTQQLQVSPTQHGATQNPFKYVLPLSPLERTGLQM